MGERFEIDIFDYVLMDNYYHLLFRTNRANLSRSMQWFTATYAKRFNLGHYRSGHLFLIYSSWKLAVATNQKIGELRKVNGIGSNPGKSEDP